MRPLTAALLLLMLLLSACSPGQSRPHQSQRPIRIGFSMDTLQEERWQRDRDLFVARARELGAEVIVQAANGDDFLQLSQAENMLLRGVDVLVVVPHNATAMAPIIEKAHKAGIRVIAYDRLITMTPVDLYISFDNEQVGRLQAEHLIRLRPQGNYVYIGGAPTDNNVHLLRRGALSVLEPFRQSGSIDLVFDGLTDEWLPENAEKLMEEALARSGGRVDAVIAGNDGTAGGIIRALYKHGLAGKVLVAGQDADLAALQRIVLGTQSMTVYKPIRSLANSAAEIAVAMARGGKPPVNDRVHNGLADVPAYLLLPVPVDGSNLKETVIKDGFHRAEDIFETR